MADLEHDPACADIGDELHFCRTCAFAAACLNSGYDKARLTRLHTLIEHTEILPRGARLFREGGPFSTIAAVRTGAVKTCRADAEGREQVLGFFLPGEVIGLNAIANGCYPCDGVVLEDTVLCQVSFASMADLATRMPALQARLFALLSEDIGRAGLLAGDFPARERLAAFILSLSRRYAARGGSATRLRLPMTWSDIACHLRLAPETISRQMKGFQEEGLMSVGRREVTIDDMQRLEALAGDMLRGLPA